MFLQLPQNAINTYITFKSKLKLVFDIKFLIKDTMGAMEVVRYLLKCIKLIGPPRPAKRSALTKIAQATQRFCHIMKRNC